MKKLFVIILSTVFALVFSSCFSVNAVTTNSFSKDKEKLINELDVKLIVDEPRRQAIYTFTVNQNGDIAIFQKNDTSIFASMGSSYSQDIRTVCVYDKYGNYKYGYEFFSEYLCALEWDSEDILNIYQYKTGNAFSLDSNGNISKVWCYADVRDVNDFYSAFINQRVFEVENQKYVLTHSLTKSDKRSNTYTQIIKISKDGSEKYIYDVNSYVLEQFKQNKIIFIISIIAIILFSAIEIRKIFSSKKPHIS